MNGASRRTRRRSPTPSPEDFVLTLWTNDPELATRADAAGVDRIGVDLERLGKAERQRGLGTWISPHRESEVTGLRAALNRAELFARVNPLNSDSPREIDSVLAAGATVLMLPMVANEEEAARFATLVAGRATAVLLVERTEAIARIEAIVAAPGIDEVHIGINDLALSLGLRNRWLVLAGDIATEVGARVLDAGLRFGLGGIGRPGDHGLPVDADLIYAEYARTGATGALISRSFLRAEGCDLPAEIRRARRELARWGREPPEVLDAAHAELAHQAERAACW